MARRQRDALTDEDRAGHRSAAAAIVSATASSASAACQSGIRRPAHCRHHAPPWEPARAPTVPMIRADAVSALIIGTVGALAGSYGGAWWRQWAGRRMPDWQAALAEDAVALTMAAAALRRPARSSSVSASR